MTIPLWSIAVGTGYVDLTPANGVTVVDVFGAGMPPVRNVATQYGLADGSLWQRHAVQDRTVTIVMSASGASMTGLHNLRATLIQAVSPHRSQPVRLWYNRDEATAKYMDGYYEAGLEGGTLKGFTEDRIPLRLWAGDPYWYGNTSVTHTLGVRQVVNTCKYVVVRSSAGAWSNVGGGLDNAPYALVRTSSGLLYAGGYFHTAGSIPAVGHIAKWNGAAWGTLGSGFNDMVLAMALAPNSDLYVGGGFTKGGAATINRIAKWNGAAWGTLGAGLGNTVNAIAFDNSGNLYAGGLFHTAGTISNVNHIAMWDGAAWHTRGAPNGLNGIVEAIAVAPDNSVYVGGYFTAVGTSTAGTCNRIAKWNGSVFSSLGAGLNSTVFAIAVGPDGQVYAGGAFSTAGNVAAACVAKWNGTSWAPMGAGLDSFVIRLACDPDGSLWAGGLFDASGSRSLPMRWAQWIDPLWIGGDSNLGTWIITSLLCQGTIVLGGDFIGALAFPGHTTINNPGSARAFPVFTLNGPGRLYSLVNYTTGQRLDFNLLLLTGEVATLDLRPGHKTFVSSFRGNIIQTVLPGDLVSWCLQPGDNYVAAWIDDASATGTYTFTAAYWSIDGAA